MASQSGRAAKTAQGAATLVLGAIALASPMFLGRSLPLLVGLALVAGSVIQLRSAFGRFEARSRWARFASAGIGVLSGLLVIALPDLAIGAAALLIGVLMAVDGAGRLWATWRELGRRGWLGELALGALLVVLGVLLAIQWPISGPTAIALVVGVRLLCSGWSILAGTDEDGAVLREVDGEVDSAALVRRLGLPAEAQPMVERLAAQDAATVPIDRWWVGMFLATFFAIHIGRMSAEWTIVGLLSPLGAALGDAGAALLLGVLLVLPGRVLLRRVSMPLERRSWAARRAAGGGEPQRRRERLRERWLEHRTALALRIDRSTSSPWGALRAGLRLGVPLVAVLVATNPIWGFSWYFNSENWVTAIWERWTEERVDGWRTAMVRAAVEASPGVAAADMHRIEPAGIASGDFSFLVVGDPGEGDPSQLVLKDRIVEMGRRDDVRFLVVSSDVIYPSGSMRDYEPKFYLPFKGFTKPIVAIPGNHDWYDALEAFGANFLAPQAARAALRARVEADLGLTSTTEAHIDAMVSEAARLREAYAIDAARQRGTYFEIQSDRFALLAIDTGILRTVDDDQMAWLRAALDRSRGKFIMAIVGHPFYAGGAMQAVGGRFAEILSLLRDQGARIVMGGDTHDFEFYIEEGAEEGAGMFHFVNGGGGAYLSIGTAMTTPASEPAPRWGHYPSRQAVVAKLDEQTPRWKWPLWQWVKRFGAWPSTPETLSAAFDFNRSPYFQSFVEVRVEPSSNRVRVLLHGAEGPVRWRELERFGAARPESAGEDEQVEFVVPMG